MTCSACCGSTTLVPNGGTEELPAVCAGCGREFDNTDLWVEVAPAPATAGRDSDGGFDAP